MNKKELQELIEEVEQLKKDTAKACNEIKILFDL